MKNKKLYFLMSASIMALSYADICITNSAIANGASEINPVMKLAMDLFKEFWWIPKLLITSIVITSLLYIKKYKIMLICFSLQGLAVLWGLILLNLKY